MAPTPPRPGVQAKQERNVKRDRRGLAHAGPRHRAGGDRGHHDRPAGGRPTCLRARGLALVFFAYLFLVGGLTIDEKKRVAVIFVLFIFAAASSGGPSSRPRRRSTCSPRLHRPRHARLRSPGALVPVDQPRSSSSSSRRCSRPCGWGWPRAWTCRSRPSSPSGCSSPASASP